jgi:large subunit ribosomal protein L25
MKVPVHFSGEEESPAFKVDKCLINHIANEIEVACLPADLPEFINVDLSGLQKGVSLHVNDVVLPKGVKVVTHGKTNPVLVAVVAPVAEVEAAPVVVAAAPAKGKKK